MQGGLGVITSVRGLGAVMAAALVLAAPVLAALVLAGCATSAQTYRLEAEVADPLGFPQGATATRSPSGWTIERREYARGQTTVRRLSRAQAQALDAALADPALYAKPQLRSAHDCLDYAPTRLDILSKGERRRLTLGCEVSPEFQAVLDILIGP